MTLKDLSPGQSGRITALHSSGELRYRMLDMGLLPGTLVTVCKVSPFGDPIELKLRGYRLALRAADAKSIEIEVKSV